MAEQFSLAGFDEPAAPTDRLFFALFPDAATATHIATLARRLRQQLGLRGKPVEPDRLHVTLHHLGDHPGFPPALVAGALQAGGLLSRAAFDIGFERAESFSTRRRGNHPFVLRGSDTSLVAVMDFQRALGLSLAQAGLGKWVGGTFTPHVTLLYDDRVVPAQPLPPVTWRVREFALVHSLLGQHRHLVLGRWSLTP